MTGSEVVLEKDEPAIGGNDNVRVTFAYGDEKTTNQNCNRMSANNVSLMSIWTNEIVSSRHDQTKVRMFISEGAKKFESQKMFKKVRNNIFSEVENTDIEFEVAFICYIAYYQLWNVLNQFLYPDISDTLFQNVLAFKSPEPSIIKEEGERFEGVIEDGEVEKGGWSVESRRRRRNGRKDFGRDSFSKKSCGERRAKMDRNPSQERGVRKENCGKGNFQNENDEASEDQEADCVERKKSKGFDGEDGIGDSEVESGDKVEEDTVGQDEMFLSKRVRHVRGGVQQDQRGVGGRSGCISGTGLDQSKCQELYDDQLTISGCRASGRVEEESKLSDRHHGSLYGGFRRSSEIKSEDVFNDNSELTKYKNEYKNECDFYNFRNFYQKTGYLPKDEIYCDKNLCSKTFHNIESHCAIISEKLLKMAYANEEDRKRFEECMKGINTDDFLESQFTLEEASSSASTSGS